MTPEESLTSARSRERQGTDSPLGPLENVALLAP